MKQAQPPRSLTREEVRAVDRCAIEELGLPGLVLMENAGLGLTDAVAGELGRLGAGPGAEVVIAVGRGNNGGDGLVLARHLDLRGYRPLVAYCGDRGEADRSGDAGVNLTVVERAGLEIVDVPDSAALTALLAAWSAAPLLVDALFGTGLSGELRADARALIEALDADPRPIVAVDIPSGLDCDRGVPLGAAVHATRTVSFVAAKVGFSQPGANVYTGQIEVVSIGCPPSCWSHVT